MSFVVGLTGGIGSGKSAVADLFAAGGATIVDTDAIAHALTAPGGAAIPVLREAFGSAVITPDGALDRAAMRRIVFAEPEERARLEAILHPLIRAESERQIRRAAGADFVVVVVPLLAETEGWRERVDRVLVIDCPEEVQVARVMARNGLTRAEVGAILAAQATRQDRLAIADDVIENTAGLDALERQVAELHARYREMALRRGATDAG
jgi:dephospho-CoA kinase